MPDQIVIRKLTTMSDLTATAALQKAVWGMHDVEVASPHTLKAIVHSGGAVFGAETEGGLVGFCFGIAAWRARELWLWSHMAAVLPALQRPGNRLSAQAGPTRMGAGGGLPPHGLDL